MNVFMFSQKLTIVSSFPDDESGVSEYTKEPDLRAINFLKLVSGQQHNVLQQHTWKASSERGMLEREAGRGEVCRERGGIGVVRRTSTAFLWL